jgi:hypothetical protein
MKIKQDNELGLHDLITMYRMWGMSQVEAMKLFRDQPNCLIVFVKGWPA